MDFNVVWKSYEVELTKFVDSKLYTKENREDVMQEVAIKLYRQLESLHTIGNLRAWLYRVTRNTLIDFYKKNSQKIPDELYELESMTSHVVEEKNEIVACIHSIANGLQESDKEILNWSIHEQYSLDEIASKLALTKEGARSKLRRAKQKVANRFFSCCHLERDTLGKIVDMQTVTSSPKCHCE